MRAAIMYGPHEMGIGEWETPEPGADEVVVAVRAAGVCSGDMAYYGGKFSSKFAQIEYPRVSGHEIAGVVASIGERVENVQVGTPVAVEPVISCGTCYPCRIGKTNCCMRMRMIGGNVAGGFAEYVAAPAKNVHPVPAGLSMALAACTEPTAIAVHACHRGNVAAGEYVLVLGCGPIGLAVIEVARARGAHVVATDLLPERLQIAEQLGAATVMGGKDLAQTILAQTNGEGAPVVIEVVGIPPVIEQAFELVAPGGRVVIVGAVKDGTTVSSDGRGWTGKEMTVLGSRNSVNCFPETMELLASGAVRYPTLAVEYSMWDAPKVLAEMYENPASTLKAILIPNGNH
ncbi:MAG TPA: alcohol dehydrogenase catalytic domain-containing protein [Anaerolineae bacterium]|nr:alcohol dehydrogenase catalytic domain-containing protein [Anaerolineae bacterium]